MGTEEDFKNIIETIARENNFGLVKSTRKMSAGFNSNIYCINNEYIIKICTIPINEFGMKNEVSFFEQSSFKFHPKMLVADLSKKIVPYFYLVEEAISGANLFDVWTTFSSDKRKEVLNQLICIMREIHNRDCNEETAISKILALFNKYLTELANSNIIANDKIDYLREIQSVLIKYFCNCPTGYIHNDIHFNNLIWVNNELKIIDFEKYGEFPLDKEFDSINRMARSPYSYIKDENKASINLSDFKDILTYIKYRYGEVCSCLHFEERLIIYDCINSMRWLVKYPEYKLYHEILFDKSKVLLK